MVTISRASGTLTFPANFMFIGALNPCPCGYYEYERKDCRCSMGMLSLKALQRYHFSGPLMDVLSQIGFDIPPRADQVAYDRARQDY